jgi:hypothetical protein
MTDEALPPELRDLLDREQIVALSNRYLGSLDDKEIIDEHWAASLFTDDVRVVHRGFEMNGLEEIAFGHRFVVEGWERTLHFTTNHRVELDGETASYNARLFAIHLHKGAEPPEPYLIANVFTAEARRTPDGWRFQSLSQETVWSSGTSHLDVDRSES